MSTDESYPPLSPSELSALLNHPIRDPLPCAEVKEILSSSPFIPLPYALNLRTVTSRTLPPNKIFRSGSLGHVPIETLTHLHTTYGITTVYDLRGEAERGKHPSPEIPGIETVWIPHSEDKDPENGPKVVEIKIEEFAANAGVDAYLKRYENVLITYGEVYKAVFERIRDGEEGGVLFHCTGKDRTGILAAFLLALTHSPPSIISQDYALTRIGTEPFREFLLKSLLSQMNIDRDRLKDDDGPGNPGNRPKSEGDISMDTPGMEEMCGTRGETMLEFLRWMDGKWGVFAGVVEDGGEGGENRYPGVEGWMRKELELSGEDIEKIREKLKAT